MRFHKLFIRMSQMGSILIEIFDVKVLNEIYPIVYIYIYNGNSVISEQVQAMNLLDERINPYRI